VKQHKAKIHVIDPVKDMVDVWRLFKSSVLHEKWEYPSLHETHEEDMRAHVISYTLQNPQFFGMMARIGKRPIGQIIGSMVTRDIGLPKNYFFIYNFWIEPELRKQGHMKELWGAFVEELRKRGIFHVEANCTEKLKNFLMDYKGFETRLLSYRIGGKL
jgi:ribosomal protein S18 acetylase RimI-like enzyme